MTVAFAGFALVAISLPSFGHHGTAIVYDLTRSVTVTGTVTDFKYVNPHAQILFNVTADDGSEVEWLAGLPSPNTLGPNEGWTRETLKPGDAISIIGAPARNDAPSIWVEQIHLNGEPLLGEGYTG